MPIRDKSKLKSIITKLCLLLIMMLSEHAIAQNLQDIKAALTYNFSKFTQWPENNNASTTWQLCYFGKQYRENFNVIGNKSINNKAITIRELNKVSDATDCHIVFIGLANEHDVQPLLIAIDKKPVLTISDIAGFMSQGGMIEMVSNQDRMQFKVNLKQVLQHQLQLSSQVLKLAIEVKR